MLRLVAGSDTSNYEDKEFAGNTHDDYHAASSTATPLTSISSKPSPRHPSDLHKSHHCPYPDCEKSFNRPAKLTQHLRSHTNTRPYVCPHAPCTKDFLRESHLKHHIKSAHSDVRDYVCEWEGCGKSFITATRLRRHRAAHEGKEKFKCILAGCGKTFRKHGTLQKHVISVHEGRDPFVCGELNEHGQECGAGFDTEGKLNSHIGRLHGMKRFLCMICSPDLEASGHDVAQAQRETTFSTHAALQVHLVSQHPPTCTECGLQCTSQSSLKSHIEVMHGGFDIDERRTHICQEPDCGRAFTKKGNLNAHIQISHTGKRFVCGEVDLTTLNNVRDWDGSDACGEALKSKANLEKHIRGVHMGLQLSGKVKKKDRQSLAVRPIQTHQISTLTRLTGAGYETESGRTICCAVRGCDYRFIREYDLEIHLQAQHGLADLEVRDMLMEREHESQPPLYVPSKATTEYYISAPSGFHPLPGKKIEMSCSNDAGIVNGADSWLDGKTIQGGIGGDGELWDEVGLRRLLHGELKDHGYGRYDNDDVDMIDPSLL